MTFLLHLGRWEGLMMWNVPYLLFSTPPREELVLTPPHDEEHLRDCRLLFHTKSEERSGPHAKELSIFQTRLPYQISHLSSSIRKEIKIELHFKIWAQHFKTTKLFVSSIYSSFFLPPFLHRIKKNCGMLSSLKHLSHIFPNSWKTIPITGMKY